MYSKDFAYFFDETYPRFIHFLNSNFKLGYAKISPKIYQKDISLLKLKIFIKFTYLSFKKYIHYIFLFAIVRNGPLCFNITLKFNTIEIVFLNKRLQEASKFRLKSYFYPKYLNTPLKLKIRGIFT